MEESDVFKINDDDDDLARTSIENGFVKGLNLGHTYCTFNPSSAWKKVTFSQ